MDAYGNNGEYMGTLSGLTRYGTMNTPSLKTLREKKGKAHIRHTPRLSRADQPGEGSYGEVRVYKQGDEDSAIVLPASHFRSTKRALRSATTQSEAQAVRQAQADYRMRLRARVAGNEEAL